MGEAGLMHKGVEALGCAFFKWLALDEQQTVPPAFGLLAVEQQALTPAVEAIHCSCGPTSCVILTDMVLSSYCAPF